MYTAEAAELGFACEALKQGFTVYIPYSDRLHYDLLISFKGTYSRVQVKHVKNPSYKGSYRAKARITDAKKKERAYTSDDCDFVAIFLEVDKIWYIIPAEEAVTHMILSPERGRNKYDQYFEAWDLLKPANKA